MDFTKTWLHQENYPAYKREIKPSNKMTKVMGLLLASFFVVMLMGCRGPQTIDYQDPESVTYELQGDIVDEAEANEALSVIEKNLQAVTEGDLDTYLETVVTDGIEDTQDELEEAFSTLDLEMTILSAEVQEQEEERMLIRIYQQTVALNQEDEENPYRDHVAEANYTMVKEEDGWKIEQTVMTNNQFIDYNQ